MRSALFVCLDPCWALSFVEGVRKEEEEEAAPQIGCRASTRFGYRQHVSWLQA